MGKHTAAATGTCGENTKRKTPKDGERVLSQVQNALFHIHSVAAIIEDIGLDRDENTENGTSNPLLSLAQIIMEKAEFCLEKIEEGEVPAS